MWLLLCFIFLKVFGGDSVSITVQMTRVSSLARLLAPGYLFVWTGRLTENRETLYTCQGELEPVRRADCNVCCGHAHVLHTCVSVRVCVLWVSNFKRPSLRGFYPDALRTCKYAKEALIKHTQSARAVCGDGNLWTCAHIA